MEVTPKLQRRSLSITSRLKSRSSASPSPRNRLRNSIIPSSPISILSDGGIEGTPPNRKFPFNPPYSPSNDADFSPRSRLSQSSINSPEVTWRWTQDEPSENASNLMSKSTPNNCHVKELRRQRSVKRKEELRKAEIEKRKAIKTKRDDVLKKQCEQVELIISKKSTSLKSQESYFIENKPRFSESSGFGSKDKEDDLFDDSAFDGLLGLHNTALEETSIVPRKDNSVKVRVKSKELNKVKHVKPPTESPLKDKDLDLLNDSESDGFLLEASQQIESSIEKKEKKSCTKELERSFEDIPLDKEKSSNYDFLQDSFDDCFALVDDDAFECKKPRTSLQRYKSMPTNSPKATTTLKPSPPDTSKIRRYPSSSTIRPKSKFP